MAEALKRKRGRQPNVTEDEVKKIFRTCRKNFIRERNKELDKKA
jgi:hypothetical protein